MTKVKTPPVGVFKRIFKRAPLIGVIFAVIVFVLDFFNVYVDFISSENRPPEIHDIRISRNVVPVGETSNAMVIASDPDGGDEIDYFWGSACGKIQLDRFGGPKVTYIAPDQPGIDVITVTVYDQEGDTVRDFEVITIIESGKAESR